MSRGDSSHAPTLNPEALSSLEFGLESMDFLRNALDASRRHRPLSRSHLSRAHKDTQQHDDHDAQQEDGIETMRDIPTTQNRHYAQEGEEKSEEHVVSSLPDSSKWARMGPLPLRSSVSWSHRSTWGDEKDPSVDASVSRREKVRSEMEAEISKQMEQARQSVLPSTRSRSGLGPRPPSNRKSRVRVEEVSTPAKEEDTRNREEARLEERSEAPYPSSPSSKLLSPRLASFGARIDEELGKLVQPKRDPSSRVPSPLHLSSPSETRPIRSYISEDSGPRDSTQVFISSDSPLSQSSTHLEGKARALVDLIASLSSPEHKNNPNSAKKKLEFVIDDEDEDIQSEHTKHPMSTMSHQDTQEALCSVGDSVSSLPISSPSAHRDPSTSEFHRSSHSSRVRSSIDAVHSVREKIDELRHESQSKSRKIEQLEDEIRHLKQREEVLREKSQDLMRIELENQKQEYDVIVRRHLAFADSLVAEKEALSEDCVQLRDIVQRIRDQHKEEMHAVSIEHENELKRQKENLLAVEKVKRENWIAEKHEELKRQTMKSLQPEVQRLIAKHKGEIRRLEEKLSEKSLSERAEWEERKLAEMEELRTRLTAERDAAVQRERDLTYEKMREHSSKLDEFMMQERQKWMESLNAERERLQVQLSEERSKIQEDKNRIWKREQELDQRMDSEISSLRDYLKTEHEAEVQALKEDHQSAMKSSIEQARTNFERDFELKLERERSAIRKENQEKLDRIIEQLEEEATNASRDSRNELRKREREWNHLREKLEKQIETMESNISLEKSKLGDRVAALEAEKARLEERLRIAEIRGEEVNSGRDVLERTLKRAREEHESALASIQCDYDEKVRREIQAKLDVQLELQDVYARIESITQEHEKHVQTMQSQHSNELDDIRKRVESLVREKDEKIRVLEKEIRSMRSQIEELDKEMGIHS